MEYEKPEIIDFKWAAAMGVCSTGSGDITFCSVGNGAGFDCVDGNSAAGACLVGNGY